MMTGGGFTNLPQDRDAMAAMIESGHYDLVLGSRILGGTARGGGMPRWRWVANRALTLVENPDILRRVASKKKDRPRLVVGFAAETDNVEAHAKAKLVRKGCDWIIANDVSGDVMGGSENEVLLVTRKGTERWPRMAKAEVALKLAERIAEAFYDPEGATKIGAAE